MSCKKHTNLRTVRVWITTLFIALGSLGISTQVRAQDVAEQTSAVTAADTASIESTEVDSSAAAMEAADTSSAAATEVAETASAPTTVAASAADAVSEGPSIPAQAYKNFYYGILLILLICVICGILGKIWNVYELTSRLNGRYNPLLPNNIQATLLLISLPIFLYGVYWSFANHGAMAWRDAVTEHGKRIDLMFITTTVICTIVLVLMHILLFSFTYKYRMRLKGTAFYYPHNNTIERIWTVVPAVVLTVLVLFGFFTWRSITNIPEELQKSAIQIEVLGEQFAWTVRYPGADGEIGKRNYRLTTPTNPYGIDFNDKASHDDLLGPEIVIPVNRSVRFHILSKDILHSFYIPDFRVQINAVPGMTTYFQFTPTVTTREMQDLMNDPDYHFVMLCNKICGSGHYNMQKRVRVVTEEEYDEWLSQQNVFFTEDMQKEFAARQTQGEVQVLDSLSGNQTAYNNL